MKLKKLLKWVDSRPVSLRWSSRVVLFCILLWGKPVASQILLFERIEAPFSVFDQQGEPYQVPFLGGFNVPRPQFVDIDGDGDQDLFVQEISNRLIFFEHLSGVSGFPFIKRSDAFLELEIGEWYRFVDLDQDGDQDLLSETSFSFIRVFENLGTASEPIYSVVQDSLRDESGTPIFADRQNILDVVDIDNDGLLDLFIGRLEGTVFHYEQAAPGSSVQDLAFSLQSDRFQNISVVGGEGAGKQEGRHGASTLFFHDIDEDGDQDLFWGDFFEPGLLFFENTGTPQVPLFPSELVRFPLNDPLMTSGYNAPAFGDVNGDGLVDMLIGVLGGAFTAFGAATDNLILFHQEPEGSFTFDRSRFLSNIDVGSDGYPVLFDVDRDGDNDLLVGNSVDPDDTNVGSLRLFENTGDAGRPELTDRGNLSVEPYFGITPTFGDVNGDGAIDMITGSFRGEMTLYRNLSEDNTFASFEAVPGFLDIPSSSSSTPFLADMDADGDLDLLVGQSSGVINYFENAGTTEQPVFNLITSSYGDIDVGRRSVPVAVDVDGDTDLDLIIGSDSNGILTFENTGTPQNAMFEPVEWFELEIQRRMVPTWSDLNGDSMPELLVGLLDGGVHYYKSVPLSSDPDPPPDPDPPLVGVDVTLFPNPTQRIAQLHVTGVRDQHVRVDVYSLLGQYLGTLHNNLVLEDALQIELDVSFYAAGTYIVRILAGERTLERTVFKVD